ncbi:hypothetical protein R3P38DRAFT_2815730 [Favolaschia claudopus]|uniref:Uncharacterized protein n=1 Tax=Favolaschia claudopus TaxID=2862362 RepID=A0AAV9Z0K9_9AGAR
MDPFSTFFRQNPQFDQRKSIQFRTADLLEQDPDSEQENSADIFRAACEPHSPSDPTLLDLAKPTRVNSGPMDQKLDQTRILFNFRPSSLSKFLKPTAERITQLICNSRTEPESGCHLRQDFWICRSPINDDNSSFPTTHLIAMTLSSQRRKQGAPGKSGHRRRGKRGRDSYKRHMLRRWQESMRLAEDSSDHARRWAEFQAAQKEKWDAGEDVGEWTPNGWGTRGRVVVDKDGRHVFEWGQGSPTWD